MRHGSGQMWKATLAWRGTNYAGWQLQPNAPTVQGCIEKALSAMCGVEEPIPARASGRTDSGVHAEMQIVAFRLPVERTEHQVMSGLNHHTPDDIVCLSAQVADDNFSPRSWTKTKLYRYRILNRIPACPFRREYVWHLQQTLDIAAMQSAVVHLVGHQDYTSFRASGCSASTPIRRIEKASLYKTDGGEVTIEFEGHGFLRHQVRIMVGTLVDVGLGKKSSAELPVILEARDRLLAGRTAPAKGLTLVKVDLFSGPREYDEGSR